MVKYDLKCLACATEFEIEKHYGDETKDRCPHCRSKMVKKIIRVSPSIHFKGDGFTLSNSE